MQPVGAAVVINIKVSEKQTNITKSYCLLAIVQRKDQNKPLEYTKQEPLLKS